VHAWAACNFHHHVKFASKVCARVVWLKPLAAFANFPEVATTEGEKSNIEALCTL